MTAGRFFCVHRYARVPYENAIAASKRRRAISLETLARPDGRQFATGFPALFKTSFIILLHEGARTLRP